MKIASSFAFLIRRDFVVIRVVAPEVKISLINLTISR
jgi:hypothetical protein